jgi:lactoylglutathione lyase
MIVQRVKYVIWADNMQRAAGFYQKVFGGEIIRANEVITEVSIAGAVIGIHSGGEGKRTWTGMSFQVEDVIAGAAEVKAAGGGLTREPAEENGEPPHLAMCFDTDGNEFMLTRPRVPQA